MNHFISVRDVPNPDALVEESIRLKQYPFAHQNLGKNKVLGLIFFNSSLRTRMSITRAAYNLGMQVMALNVSQDSWQLEMEDGSIMNEGTVEHIREAIPVISSYCDILAVRSFPGLKDREQDYKDRLIRSFAALAGIPIINLESATLHPLQSLADLMTIRELQKTDKPKVVLSWAPHVRPLPQSVANSFAEWMIAAKMDLTITHPPGMDLSVKFTGAAPIVHQQENAFEDADFIYVKNWSSFSDYGKFANMPEWMVTQEKLALTKNARLMHCLPVRRNVVIADDVLNSSHSVVIRQAENRLFTAQAVLKKILEATQ
ncbi:MAG: N-acetylornithine carbamoyltransferase [Ekhidna sp.]|nr:N-acetylornithine carbamoyltransferase [Ekhidna sp.]MBC6426522.1 N-acetylornithine carbamoyltransferase [Ekhidna sp.]